MGAAISMLEWAERTATWDPGGVPAPSKAEVSTHCQTEDAQQGKAPHLEWATHATSLSKPQRYPTSEAHQAELRESISHPPAQSSIGRVVALGQGERHTIPHLKQEVNVAIKQQRGQLPVGVKSVPYTTDTAAMVQTYLRIAKDSFLWPDIQAGWDLRGDLLEGGPCPGAHWMMHRAICATCKSWPPWPEYRQVNHLNSCWIKIPVAWLGTGYIAPLTKEPGRGGRANAPTIQRNPRGVAAELAKMDAERASEQCTSDMVHTINPMTVVFKDIEKYRARRVILSQGLRIDGSQWDSGDYINELLEQAVASPLLTKPDITKLKTRICCDASRTLNLELPSWPFKYHTVQDVVQLLPPNGCIASVDLKAAFLQVQLNPKTRKYYGFKIGEIIRRFRNMIFGTRDAPAACNTLTGLVAGFMKAHGILVVVMTDDFAIVAASEEECWAAFRKALDILTQLKWVFSEAKLGLPAPRLTFLGIHIDAQHRILSIPEDRLAVEFERITAFLQEREVSKHDVEKLAGRLQWVATVCTQGRPYIALLYTAMKGASSPFSRILIDGELRADLEWWANVLRESQSAQMWTPMYESGVMAFTRVISDASPSWGYGVIGESGVVQGQWLQQYNSRDSTYLELVALREYIRVHGTTLRNKVLIFTTDNSSTAININKGTARDARQRALLKELALAGREVSCVVMADHVLRRFLKVPDELSRGVPYSVLAAGPLRFIHG